MRKRQAIFAINKDFKQFIISLLAILERATATKKLVIENGRHYFADKPPHEIVELGFDMKELEEAISKAFKRKERYLCLSHEDTETFRKSIYAAYYFLSERDGQNPFYSYYIQLQDKKFI